jgi:hypothetical protein
LWEIPIQPPSGGNVAEVTDLPEFFALLVWHLGLQRHCNAHVQGPADVVEHRGTELVG